MVVPLGVLLVLKMYRPYSFCFLVLALAPWTAAEMGNVLGFATSGDFEYYYSKEKINIHKEQSELVNVWIKKDNKDFVKLLCNKIEMNADTDSVISQLRATLVTKEEVELDNFLVTECNKDTLLTSILVTQTKDEGLKKEYKVIFKDDKGGCQQRGYLVKIPPNEENPSTPVTRSKPEVAGKSECPINGKARGLVSGWLKDGLTHGYTMLNEYITSYRFECDVCFVLCGKAKSGNLFVDLIVGDLPVDRVKVSSCTKMSLQKSIKFDIHLQADKRWKGIYMDYLKSDGTCYSRKYQYDIQATQDRMMDIAYIKRGDPKINIGCIIKKAQEIGRSVVKTLQYQVGKIINGNIKTKPDN